LPISSVTSQWESLFILYAIIGTIVGAIVTIWLITVLVRYRARSGAKDPDDAPKVGFLPPDRGTTKAALVMTVLVAGILFALAAGTFETVHLIENPPEESRAIKVIARQWQFEFVYPDGTSSVGEVTVRKGEPVVFDVTSEDVFHNFGLVEFRVRTDAIPGKVNQIWINPEQEGIYKILCYELCGVGHSFMSAKLIVTG